MGGFWRRTRRDGWRVFAVGASMFFLSVWVSTQAPGPWFGPLWVVVPRGLVAFQVGAVLLLSLPVTAFGLVAMTGVLDRGDHAEDHADDGPSPGARRKLRAWPVAVSVLAVVSIVAVVVRFWPDSMSKSVSFSATFPGDALQQRCEDLARDVGKELTGTDALTAAVAVRELRSVDGSVQPWAGVDPSAQLARCSVETHRSLKDLQDAPTATVKCQGVTMLRDLSHADYFVDDQGHTSRLPLRLSERLC